MLDGKGSIKIDEFLNIVANVGLPNIEESLRNKLIKRYSTA